MCRPATMISTVPGTGGGESGAGSVVFQTQKPSHNPPQIGDFWRKPDSYLRENHFFRTCKS